MTLAAKVVSAVRWAAALTLLMQLLTWAVTLIVIRLLTPGDYGLMAMSMVFVSFAMLANEAGLGSALVQKAEATDDQVKAVHGFVLLLNIGLYGLFYISAPWIAKFFEEPALIQIVRVVALLFPILGAEVAPLALIEKRLEFKKKSGIYLVANVSGVIVSLLLALWGAGVWSLIYGNIWSAIIKSVAINISAGKLILPVISLTTIRPFLKFGGLVAAERILWYLYSQADLLLIGKLLGKEQLGYYYVALSLASIVYAKTGGLIYEVSLPTFASAQSDLVSVGRFFIRALRVVSFVVFPLMFGLAAVSTEAVGIFLGNKWVDAAPLVLILSLSMPARILSNLFPPALQGIGHPKASLVNLGFALAVMSPAFAIGALFDTRSVALAWLLVFPVVLFVIILRSRKLLGIRWSEVASAIIPPFMVSALMLFIVMIAGSFMLSTDIALIWRLLSMTAVGAAVCAGISWFGLRAQWLEFWSLVRRR